MQRRNMQHTVVNGNIAKGELVLVVHTVVNGNIAKGELVLVVVKMVVRLERKKGLQIMINICWVQDVPRFCSQPAAHCCNWNSSSSNSTCPANSGHCISSSETAADYLDKLLDCILEVAGYTCRCSPQQYNNFSLHLDQIFRPSSNMTGMCLVRHCAGFSCTGLL